MRTTANPQTTAIALNRFGLGARAGEAPPADGQAWLLDQFERYQPLPAAWADQPKSDAIVASYADYVRNRRQATGATAADARQQLAAQMQERYRTAVNARVGSALVTPAPFVERLVHFWANHFAVSTDKNPIGLLAGSFEAEAIRPHVLGRFEDLLLAAERHPAMLVYLDQVRSVGPDSTVAQRRATNNPNAQRGLNENLAREIMELHTLGVRSGYAQADVTEFARALTGWTVAGLPGVPPNGQDGTAGGFSFQPAMHERGDRTVLGRSYSQRGEAQARAILHDLAVAPATARHIAYKLARHFVADTPPPPLVDRLADVFVRSSGDLPGVYRALVEAPQAWAMQAPKFKTPWEWTISTLRGLDLRDAGTRPFAQMLAQLGQPVWRPGSPAGFDDVADSWAAPDSLMRRVEAAQRIATQADGRVDARVLGPQLLPGGWSDATASAVARAESPATALALLLVSPEFLRR